MNDLNIDAYLNHVFTGMITTFGYVMTTLFLVIIVIYIISSLCYLIFNGKDKY